MPGSAPARGPWRRLWPAAGLPLLPALGIGFLGDDLAARVLLGHGRWDFVLESLAPRGGEFYRPLGVLWLKLEMLLTGGHPLPLHALHLTVFAVAAWQTGRLARRLGFSGPWEAVAALALCYPGRLETAVWLLGVFDLLALVLVQAGMLVFLDPGRRRAAGALAVLAFLAPAAKEVGYGLAPVLTLWWLAGVGRRAGSGRRLGAAWGGAAAAVGLRLVAFGGVGGYQGTSLSAALGRLPRVPGVLLEAFLHPVNPLPGPWSRAVGIACALAGAAFLVLAVAGAARLPAVRRLAGVGASVVLLFLLPAVAYLPTDPTWYHSRYLALPAAGIVLVAAAGLEAAGRWRRPVLGLVLASWLLATAVNMVPWVRAARAREVIVASVERVTRGPGPHTVWIDGPIGHLDGAHLVGGFLPFLLEEELPGREIRSDSRFLQRLEGRPQSPPETSGGTLHLFRFVPDPPAMEEIPPTDAHVRGE